MEKTQKLEAAWWWARNARLEALRQKREEYGDPRNPLRALPGREAEFEAATELSQSWASSSKPWSGRSPGPGGRR